MIPTIVLKPEEKAYLAKIAKEIATPGKGILAADESTGTIGNRFKGINVANTLENRRIYRQLLFSTPNLSEHISGVILFDETFYQKNDEGVSFVKLLADQGIHPGIKVDKGLVPLLGTSDEVTTQGLDGLAERCIQYKNDGAVFTKWRCVLKISPTTPSELAMKENANVLARYASICQKNGLVPIVEPEVLCDGSHDLETAERVTEAVLSHVYRALHQHHVFLEGTLLKPSMVTAGQSYQGERCYTPAECGLATITALRRTVPSAVPGITFLSGGQSELESSLNLNAVNLAGKIHTAPWNLSFSFGRALQHSVLRAWLNQKENVEKAQNELQRLARNNGEAALGRFSEGEAGGADSCKSLFVENHVY